MWQILTVISYLVITLRISIVDIKTHYIKNLDLLILLIATILAFQTSLFYAGVNLIIYLVIFFLMQKQLGIGDIKLSFVIGLAFKSFYSIFLAFNLAWLMGGFWALFSGQKKVAFAPWMLLGASLTQILAN